MIDLAVPRDIEPQVSEIPDIYLYTVDDMREVIEENLRLRASEASKADEIVTSGIAALKDGLLERQSACSRPIGTRRWHCSRPNSIRRANARKRRGPEEFKPFGVAC